MNYIIWSFSCNTQRMNVDDMLILIISVFLLSILGIL